MHFARNDQRGGSVEQDGVAVGAGFALKQRAQGGSVVGGVSAANGIDRSGGQACIGRRYAAQRKFAVFHFGEFIAARKAELVEAFIARNDKAVRGAEALEGFGVDRHIGRPRDADELAADACGVGQRSHQIKDGAAAQRLADGHDAAHRRVVLGCEKEADAEVGQRFLSRFGSTIKVEAEDFQRVSRASFGTGGAVAVLSHGDAASRDDEADGGGNVERVVSVTAGAADVDGVGRRGDRDHAGAHRPRGSGDFAGGFAPVGQGDEELRDLLVGHLAIEDGGEGQFRFGFFERVEGIGQSHAGSGLVGMPQI